MTPEKVIAPATPFESLVDSVVKTLKDMPSVTNVFKERPTAVAGACFAILLIFVFVLKKSKRPQETSKSDKKPEKKSSKKE